MPAHMKAAKGFDLRRLRMRSIVLILAIVASVVVSTVHIRAVGSTYLLELPESEGAGLTEEGFQITPENMAEVVSLTYEGNVPVAEIHALSEGDGMLIVSTESSGMMTSLAVRRGLCVVEGGVNVTGWEYLGWCIAVCFSIAAATCL